MVLADAVIGLSGMVLVAELLGTVGWFGASGLVIGLALTSAAVLLVVRDAQPTRAVAVPPPAPSVPRWHLLAGAIALLPVAASWMARVVRVFDEGIRGTDTVWYHLPAAVRFLQSGETTAIQFFDDGPLTAYFPMTSSLLHGAGMALFGTDLLTAVVNFAALSMALLAGWRFGARFGVAVPAAVAVGLFLGSPLMVETQAATALNDVVGVALLLTAVALVVQVEPQERTLGLDVVVGLALGLAIGLKVTFLVPAGVLAIGLVVTGKRGARLRALLLYGATAATGLYWYARNTIETGSPVPVLDVALGPLRFEPVTNSPDTQSVSSYLFDGDAWRDYFVPGFADALGPLWFAFLALAAIGLLGTLVRPAVSSLRLVAVVGIASLVAFVFTPQYLDLGEGKPFFFPTNLRYGAAGLAIGVLLAVVVLRRAVAVVLPGLVVATFVAQADPAVWPVFQSRPSFFLDHINRRSSLIGSLVVLGLAGIVAVVTLVARRSGRRIPVGAAILAGALAVVLLVGAALPRYTDHRYAGRLHRGGLFPWGSSVTDARIGAIGLRAQLQYPLAGPDLSNHVDYLVVQTPDGGARPPETCDELLALIEAGRYDYLVAVGNDYVPWVAGQPDAEVIPDIFDPADSFGLEEEVFRLDRGFGDRSC